MQKKIIVTGALGYSGKEITGRLLDMGHQVKSLTNSLNKPNPFSDRIVLEPFNFDKQDKLIASLSGYDVLINTYWVRFNHKKFNHADAVTNSKILFDSAKAAGIGRVVHVSITNPSPDSDLEYFRDKAILEDYLASLDVDHSIVRPAVLFGKQDVLINNIAWMVRHLPVFGIFGKGNYRIQPVHVEDLADIIIGQISNTGNVCVNALGPESFTYKELVRAIMNIINVKRPIIHVPPSLGYYAARLISMIKGDVAITRDEIKGLMENYLYVNDHPTGKIMLTEWLKANKDTVGKVYANELNRRA